MGGALGPGHVAAAATSLTTELSPYLIPATSPVDTDLGLADVPHHQVRFLEKIGDGAFGTVRRLQHPQP